MILYRRNKFNINVCGGFSHRQNSKRKMKEKVFKQKRKAWFRGLKQVIKIRYRRVQFIYLGEKPTEKAIILSNHVGTDAPLSLEIYADFPIRLWGAYEMNSGLKKLYKYQTEVYYHQKRGWNLHLARMYCLLASPLTNLFYKGLNLISTYQDTRLRKTLDESFTAISDNGESIVIFPEDSSDGYCDELKGFHAGFVMLAEKCLNSGIDVPVYVSYFKKKERQYIFDAPVKYSELKTRFGDRNAIAGYLCDRCNKIGKMQFEKPKKTKKTNA